MNGITTTQAYLRMQSEKALKKILSEGIFGYKIFTSEKKEGKKKRAKKTKQKGIFTWFVWQRFSSWQLIYAHTFLCV